MNLVRPIVAAAVWLLTIAAVAASSQAPASPVETYLAAVRTYVATRDAGKAVTELQGWSKAQFTTAIEGLIKRGDQRLIEAAALLQLEIGLGVVQRFPASAMGYCELGHTLLNSLSPSADRDTVRSNWHAVAASAFLMMNDAALARPWVDRGMRSAPASARLLLLSGLVDEVRAEALNPRWFNPGVRQTRASREYRALLSTAELRYRSALKQDPVFAHAAIRLGRVSWLLGKGADARSILEQARVRSTKPADVYQAALFLADLQREAQDLAGARDSYERALAARPNSQLATVGLGYLYLLDGRPDRAQALAQSFAAHSATDTDWWTQRNGGVDQEALTWLRERVRQ